MKNVRRDKRSIFRGAAVALLILFLVAAVLFVIEAWEKVQGRFPSSEVSEPTLIWEEKEYVWRDNVETFLVLGLDKFEGAVENDSYTNDQQADFLMLFVFDNEAKTCTAIHINRDTMATMTRLGVAGQQIGYVTQQIALSHTYGNGRDVSCRNAADAVSELLLGTKVDHYISLTMDAVAILNDQVDGVEVEVLHDFTGIDDTLVKGETVTLRGEQALTYVRSRYGLEDPTNNTRMERQRQYLNALYQKVAETVETDADFIVDASLELSDYLISDRSVTQLQDLAEKFFSYEFTGIRSFEGVTKVGESFIEFYPDAASVKKTVVELFCELKKTTK